MTDEEKIDTLQKRNGELAGKVANLNRWLGEEPNVWKYCGHCFAGEMKHRG